MSERLEMIGEVTELFGRDAYYSKLPLSLLTNSVLPALDHDKWLAWFKKDHTLIGFCSYAFLKKKEIKENKFDGKEVFSRDDGEALHICQFVCDGDRKDVFSFVRHIQKTLSSKYPDRPFASATRKLSGSQRPAKYVKGTAQ
tara:strand:+ start:44 stop:469 length:426 start_codon:yes stop_codon:yes gene_type:complete